MAVWSLLFLWRLHFSAVLLYMQGTAVPLPKSEEMNHMSCHGVGRFPNQQVLLPILLIAPCLVSCGEEDRIVKVACDFGSGEEISINLATSQPESAPVAQLNVHHFTTGTVLQLTPAESPDQFGSESVVHVLKLPADKYLPVRSPLLSGTVTSGHFEIEMDPDVVDAAAGFEKAITKNIGMYYEDGNRKVLQDSVAVINADHGALRAIQSGSPSTRFVVVSGVWSGGRVSYLLNDSGPFIAVNTLKAGRFYLHLKYACLPPTARSEADATQPGPEFLFSYLPIRYDLTTKMAILDMRPLDLTKFLFVARR